MANPTSLRKAGVAITKRASSAQAAVTLTAAQTSAALTGTLTGTANGSLVDIAATAGSCAGGGTPGASDVDTAIATAVASIVTGVNEQNKELQAMINKLVVEMTAVLVDNTALAALVAEQRTILINAGLAKGSA